MRPLAAVVLCGLLTPTLAIGQSISGGLGATHLRLGRTSGATTETLSGTALGLVVGARMGRVALALDYLEGTISSEDGAIEEDAVEGEAILLVHATPWIAFGTGAHARAFVTDAGTQRWVFWEARVQTQASLFGPFRGHFAAWRALTATVNLVDPFDSGYGVDGGIAVSFGQLPVEVRARYRAEHVSLGSGARAQTNERFGVVVTVGRS